MNTDRPRKIVVGIDEVHFSRALRLIRRALDCSYDTLDLLPEWNVAERDKLEKRIEALMRFTEHEYKEWWDKIEVRQA